jgi:DNA-binding NarL/FixJ family response regulator
MSTPVRVLIADDHPLFRDGLAALLNAGQDTELAGAATSGLPTGNETCSNWLPRAVPTPPSPPGCT